MGSGLLKLREFADACSPFMVLTGAGISTDSGIPAYRDSTGQWMHRLPVQHRAFVENDAVRQRYWARSLIGWPAMHHARPNASHRKLVALEEQGMMTGLVTQNVDRLHQKAGSKTVIDLHGRADELVCLSCGQRQPRLDMHQACIALNPGWSDLRAPVAPDGDAVFEADTSAFKVPGCPHCNGILKPDVVFFGDTVPRERVDQAFDTLARSRGLLVIGSSLMVYSGFRFARRAAELDIPLAIVTLGQTRADDLAQCKIDAPIDQILASI